MIYGAEHFFYASIDYLGVLCEKMSSAHFEIRLFAFLIIELYEFLIYLNIDSLSEYALQKIFSHACLLNLLIISFAMQNVLSLM